MTNHTDIFTGLAGSARATRLGVPALGRVRMGVAMKHDATAPSLAVRWNP
jgi:hypothetical protein